MADSARRELQHQAVDAVEAVAERAYAAGVASATYQVEALREGLAWAIDYIECEGAPDGGFDPATEPEDWNAHFDAKAALAALSAG